VGFDISRVVPEQTVTGDPVAHAAGIALSDRSPIPPFQLSVDLAAESAPYSIVVQRVLLKKLAFDISLTNQPAGDTDCWDFVDELHVSVESTQAGSTLPRTEVASIAQPGCVSHLEMSVRNTVNLKPYIEQGLRLIATGTGLPPADDVSFTGAVTLRAEAF
jgi:hypothetical protein